MAGAGPTLRGVPVLAAPGRVQALVQLQIYHH
jgi:hypothetical protein